MRKGEYRARNTGEELQSRQEIKECLSQQRSAERGGNVCRLKLKRVNLDCRVPTGTEKCLSSWSCTAGGVSHGPLTCD